MFLLLLRQTRHEGADHVHVVQGHVAVDDVSLNPAIGVNSDEHLPASCQSRNLTTEPHYVCT